MEALDDNKHKTIVAFGTVLPPTYRPAKPRKRESSAVWCGREGYASEAG